MQGADCVDSAECGDRERQAAGEEQLDPPFKGAKGCAKRRACDPLRDLRPRRASFAGRPVTDREHEIHHRRASTGEFISGTFRAQALSWESMLLQWA